MSVYSKLRTFQQFEKILPLPSLSIFVLTFYSNHGDSKGHSILLPQHIIQHNLQTLLHKKIK